MIKILIEKTINNSVTWIKTYNSIFSLRLLYENHLYILYSTSGEARLHILTYDGILVKITVGNDVRDLYTAAKKQYFGENHNQTYKRK